MGPHLTAPAEDANEGDRVPALQRDTRCDAASRSEIAAGAIARTLAAANSSANGNPSTSRQIASTAAELSSVSAKSGRIARARSTNKASTSGR